MKNAVIFDMDGVVSDTQKFHAKVESLLLRELGIEMTPAEITKKYAGVGDDVMFEELFRTHGITNIFIPEIIEKKWNLMQQLVSGKITVISYAAPLIKKLKEHDFKLAIASASTKVFIETVLEELTLASYFDVLVSSQDVLRGKPAPDIFLLAAKQLNVQPRDAIVIEDGRSGMIAATAAGMKSIGLVPKISDMYPATLLVTTLRDVTLEKIRTLYVT